MFQPSNIKNPSRPRIVVLTAGGINSRRLSKILIINGIEFKLVTISFPLPKKGKRSLRYLFRYVKRLVTSIELLRRIKMRNLPQYSMKPIYGGLQNSIRLIKTLKGLNPDYILMMGGGILNDSVISIANQGVLNVHPGLLPYIRGVDAISHSILRGIRIGASCHFIDTGIDTGGIIKRYYLPFEEVDDLASLEERMNHLSVALMMSITKKIWKGDELECHKQTERYPLCKKLSLIQKVEVVELIKKRTYHIMTMIKDDYDSISSGNDLMIAYKRWWNGYETF